MNGNAIKLDVHCTVMVEVPGAHSREPYPEGFWGRYILNRLTDDDQSYLHQQMVDRFNGHAFATKHQENERLMDREREKFRDTILNKVNVRGGQRRGRNDGSPTARGRFV